MVWSNWQKAISRGAVLVLLLGSGLAWTQSPDRPAADPAERIMVVHENGKSTRCRVLESWQLPDGRVAHLLEALDTGERITIVDDQAPAGDRVVNPRAMPKRIFSWGLGRKTPPEGSPVPPQLRQDSGIVIKNETPPPSGAVPIQGPAIINRVDEKVIGGAEAPIIPIRDEPSKTNTKLLPRLFPKLDRSAEPQVVDFPKQGPGAPLVINELPKNVGPIVTKPAIEPIPTPVIDKTPSVGPRPPLPPVVSPRDTSPAIPQLNPNIDPNSTPIGPVTPDLILPEPSTQAEPQSKKGWRPGANIHAWLNGKSTPRTDDSKKVKKAEDYLVLQNKAAEKQLTEKIEKLSKSPFSTAMLAPDAKKPEPTPLAIPFPNAPKDDKVALPPAPETPKPTEVKRDMWGGEATTPMLPPGRSLLDQSGVKPEMVKLPPPPQGRTNDPLTLPERLNPKDTAPAPRSGAAPISQPKGVVSPPPSRNDLAPPPPEFAPNSGMPLGAQSVLAAKSGLLGPVTYVPVPTVTVPQPHTPPMPPPPQMPEAPQLNANVNAFSQPVAPRTPQEVPWQQSGAFSNPMSQQQQILAQQQQMLAQQQQMLAQQAMMQYGYAMNPYAMNPYLQQQRMSAPMAYGMPYGHPMQAQGPMTNFSRVYSGPMAPNPFAANPSVQTGYAPQGYPYQAPMQAMMPQPMQPVPQHLPTQQASHHVPTQAQSVTQQVEQLIKVLRESSFPAQREWAAQSLTSYDWRVHPQIVPAILQSAGQDPAASVRAGCVYCLGRMGAAVEPVFGTLHSLRNDIDPRVRQEVEQAFGRLGQTPQR